MRDVLPALIVGAIFGAGLTVSDMVNPARVQAFLDVAGAWDATLAFVMAAAILPSALAHLIRRRMARPVLADRFFVPEGRTLDQRLLLGAALFGIGGGFLIVPGLVAATGMPMINAIGSSLVAVAAFGLTTAVNYAFAGLVDWPIAFVFIAGGVLGGVLGAALARRLSHHRGRLTAIFAALIFVVAAYMLWKSAAAWWRL